MATGPSGFICFDNHDLIRDGYIPSYMTKVWDAKGFNLRKLNTKTRGITYTVERNANGEIVKIYEKRILLPASKIKLEILFSTVLKSAVTAAMDMGGLAALGWGGEISSGLALEGHGGTSAGKTELTYHICDTETKINSQIKITKNNLSDGIIELPNYPVSVFGVVKEHIEIIGKNNDSDIDKKKEDYKKIHPSTNFRVNAKEEIEAYFGLDFNEQQLEVLGNYFAGTYEGSPRLDIRGATDSDGLFHGFYNLGGSADKKDGVLIEQILGTGQENLFLNIVNDIRLFKFRGDNSAEVDPLSRMSPFVSNPTIDITSKKIKIKTEDLKEGDILYITYCGASERKIRQNVRHHGVVFQDNTIGVGGAPLQYSKSNDNDVFDYHIKKWYVPKNIPSSFDSPDAEFVLDLDTYYALKNQETAPSVADQAELIEGWRMSGIISTSIDRYWAADYRGILLVTKHYATVVYEYSKIRDKKWFDNYLLTLPWLPYTRKDANGKKIIDTVEKKIETGLKIENLPECSFDISEVCNSQLYDKQKVPYYRLFAKALKNCSKFNPSDPNSGIGCPNLDILYNTIMQGEDNSNSITDAFSTIISNYNDEQMAIMDMSNSDFMGLQAKPTPKIDCNSDSEITPDHYSCNIYDTGMSGGIFYSRDYLNAPILYMLGQGGNIEANWMLETPYFCGDFTTKSRVYIERMGGKQNNWSMIYATTAPSNPHTISLDNNSYTNSSLLSFWDDKVNTSTSLLKFIDAYWEQGVERVEYDTTQSNERKAFNHYECQILGYNKILGSIPNYSNGISVTNEISKIYYDKTTNLLQQYEINVGTGALDFNADIPSLTISNDLNIKDITIVYTLKDSAKPLMCQEKNQSISLYFKGSDSAITNIPLLFNKETENTLTIKCHYYNRGPIEFYGGLLKHINVSKCYTTVLTRPVLDYAVQSSQTSIVFDKMGRTLLFFGDDKSGNISVAVSYDNGENWEIYTDIIRLIAGERATLPQAFSDNGTVIRLFYVLNDTYLMCKKIDSNWLVQDDLFKTYKPPSSYDENSKDDIGDSSLSSLYPYSIQGKQLRREPSYFVEGNKSDDYFKKEIAIASAIKLKNSTDPSDEQKQSIRFILASSDKQMTKNYNGNAYTVFIDKKGFKRVFLLENNKLTIKCSPNFSTWIYDISEAELHKNFFKENQGETAEIKNIQVVRNSFEKETINLLYFHNGMLFLRIIQSGAFDSSDFKKDGQKNDDTLKEYFKITPTSGNNPIFLIGNIPDEIKTKIGAKDENGTPLLAITFPYNEETLSIFDSKFEIDTDTQAFGYYTRKGAIRVFYKDANGNLNALSIEGFRIPTPEVLYRLKRTLV